MSLIYKENVSEKDFCAKECQKNRKKTIIHNWLIVLLISYYECVILYTCTKKLFESPAILCEILNLMLEKTAVSTIPFPDNKT